MTSLLMPAAPAMDEPLEILEACHGRIEQQLMTLEKLSRHLELHGADSPAVEAARSILRYFDTAGQHHHQDEEVDLFPRLRQRAGDGHEMLKGLLDTLLAQHQDMFSAWGLLREKLVSIAAGNETALPLGQVHAFSQLYRRHIALENTSLLPLARSLLLPEDCSALSDAMVARRRAPHA